MRNFCLTIGLSFAAAAAAAPPLNVGIAYEIARNDSPLADVDQRLEHDGRTYTLSETWKGKGLYALRGEAVRSSRGAIVADGKRVTSYTYKVAGRERVKTPAGEFDALKLVKRKDNPLDKATEVWLAVDQQYIPVRILVVEKDGTRLDQVAVKISVR